jgi:hypothetical protein
MRLYNSDGSLKGETVDGTFVPVVPVPTGDAFDDLFLETVNTVENYFTLDDRLHSDLKTFKGQPSLLLTDGRNRWGTDIGGGGIRRWISQGNLRSAAELETAINAFNAQKERAVRLRRIEPDWQLDAHGLRVIGSMFGLPAPPPLPTPEELKAKQEASAKEYMLRSEESRRREAEFNARLEQERLEFEASPEGLRLKKVAEVMVAIDGDPDARQYIDRLTKAFPRSNALKTPMKSRTPTRMQCAMA